MLRVLLAHADTDDRAMYAGYLRDHGMEVTEVPTTDTALALASLHDVLVTGLDVPGTVTAIELIGRIRSLAPERGIVVVTGSTRPGRHEAARQAGCDCLLLKPCLPTELLQAVQDVVANRDEERALQRLFAISGPLDPPVPSSPSCLPADEDLPPTSGPRHRTP